MNIRLCLCTGNGGARHGFVAGWLGNLPNFIDNQWYIDLETGHSNGRMGIAKNMDRGMSFNDFLDHYSFVLSPNADVWAAVQCHGHFVIPNNIDHSCVKIINVDLSNADPRQVQWDFLVKTYLRKNRDQQNYENNGVQWNIDKSINQSVITNQDRVNQFKHLASSITYHRLNNLVLPSSFKIINLDYEKLFQINGSQYLCDQLSITVNEKYHCFWNQMLLLATSPETLTVWDTVWRRCDFFN